MPLQGHHVHFVCVNGIGMSALAHLALERGATVSGCDLAPGANARALAERGCTICQGHDPAHLEGVELVVRSSAIAEDHPEIAAARDRQIPVISRARMLARFADGRRTVAIAGSHGKTTTTWLVGKLLVEAGLDPAIVVGGIVGELGGTCRLGGGELFVAEVDESDGSLLEFAPTYSIVTNIDHDHVDRYETLEDVKAIFGIYLGCTAPDGCVIACVDDAPLRETLADWGGPARTYGFLADAAVRAEKLRQGDGASVFDVRYPGGELRDLELSLPGRHNVQNALAGIALATALDVPEAAIRQGLSGLCGVDRRLQYKGTARGVRVYDDYAHHPTELRTTLAAARRLAGQGRLVGVFQPHRYSRTQGLCERFGDCFDELDHLVLLPIYAAGEAPVEGVSSEAIAAAVRRHGRGKPPAVLGWEAARDHLLAFVRPGDLMLTLGAGNVYRLGEEILALLTEQESYEAVR